MLIEEIGFQDEPKDEEPKDEPKAEKKPENVTKMPDVTQGRKKPTGKKTKSKAK